jgi:dihydroorotate dehydrogenase
MKEILITIRNSLIRISYKLIIRNILFLTDPEYIHDKTIQLCQFFGRYSILRGIASLLFFYSNPVLNQEIRGIKFPNPIGLSAGFDKDALLTNILPCLGFGFAEVGSITGEPCEGNPKPRLWRLEKSKGLVIYYGLKNEGCEKISKRLKTELPLPKVEKKEFSLTMEAKVKKRTKSSSPIKKFKIPIGTSIAKTNNKNTAETDKGIKDYLKAYKCFTDIGDYFTINISCPNAFGGAPFSDPERLNLLLNEIDKIGTKKPIFLKVSPDLSESEIDNIISISKSHRIDGFICTNLTKDRNNKKIIDKVLPENGGISGKVVEELSNNLISYVYKKTQGKFIIIGCGGVFSAEDAYKKIKLGANLVELITGMIFEGPQLISEINQGLVRLLKKDGFTNISQAVGADTFI